MRCFDAILLDAYEEHMQINKSASTDVSAYSIYVETVADLENYKSYTLAMNELEAFFPLDSEEVSKFILRDTDVHKKLEFSLDAGSQFIYARGQDVVGENSEVINTTATENIARIVINEKEFNHPIDIQELYNHLVEEDISTVSEEEATSTKWWSGLEGDELSV